MFQDLRRINHNHEINNQLEELAHLDAPRLGAPRQKAIVYIGVAALMSIMPYLIAIEPCHKSSGLPANCAQLTLADLAKLEPTLENIKARMDDWPQINYYAKYNATLKQPLANEKRVVFLGDSIFEYWLMPKNGGFFPGKPYINRGISAQTTPQILLRLRADVIALKPRAMVLLAGANDIGQNTGPITFEQFQDNIASMAELATIHGIKVVLGSILPTSNYHFDGKDPRGPQTAKRPLDKIRACNAWLKEYCAKSGFVYIDYFSALVDTSGMLKRNLSDDDVHPNRAGYAIMAPLTEKAIAQALK